MWNDNSGQDIDLMEDAKYIWVAWENQRRSVELSKYFKCKLYIFEYNGLMRYPILTFKTLLLFISQKPLVIFVQNPSMLLAALACLYGLVANRKVIVDRHTTFLLNRKKRDDLRIKIFKLLHKFTVRTASVTIVTNEYLASLVNNLGGNAVILPDILPSLKQKQKINLKRSKNLVLISSYGKDEPIKEVFEAMRIIKDKDVHLYITGNYKKLDQSVYTSAPQNVTFTGFLPEQEYQDLLFSSDIILALTNSEHCMLCGCYEAIAASIPLITSNMRDLRAYFTNAVFVDNSEKSIARGIIDTINNIQTCRKRIIQLKKQIESNWDNYTIPIHEIVEDS